MHTRSLVPGAKSQETPLVVPLPRVMELSHDGSRIAVATGDRIEVYEVATARLLGVAPNVGSMYPSMAFVTADRLQFVAAGLRELDLAQNKVSIIGEPPPNRWTDDSFIIGQIGGSRLLLLSPDHRRMRVIDRATGKVEREIADVSTPQIGGPRVLAIPQYPENATLVGFGRDGQLVLWNATTGVKHRLPA